MPKEKGAGGSEPKEGEPMHTHREHTLTRSAYGGLACLAGIAVLLALCLIPGRQPAAQ